jgi:hypothetical protein
MDKKQSDLDKIFAEYEFDDTSSDEIVQAEFDIVDVTDERTDELLGGLLGRALKLYDLGYHVANTERTPRSIEVAGKILSDVIRASVKLKELSNENQNSAAKQESESDFKATLVDLIDTFKSR